VKPPLVEKRPVRFEVNLEEDIEELEFISEAVV
jgi:hypothetical protein